ncbi:zinc finger and SCAN domain-containing protein 2-like [Entelurus aequoreus]|uniref:zinc finger and SCAN domain-containing protein 2-like n=1 Tax=Entelurus aequoreus TaxID=161455 RepID=UPI002B1D2A88|nr:zinc finger and SCAN domain-containing protein 2-like [Entelurus aequoreus]
MSQDIKPEVSNTQEEMCEFQKVRKLMEERLNVTAEEIFGVLERTIAEYEEELSRTKEENKRLQELLDAVFKPQVVLHRADVQRVSAGSHEEIPSGQQEWHTSVGQKELQALSHIKGEQLHDEDEAQSLQLHHSQSEENRGAELVTQHITEADGEHCEDIKSEPDRIFAPLSDMDDMMSDSSDHSDHIQKPLESKHDSKGDTTHHTNNKHFDCSECGKSFRRKSNVTRHMRIHTGEKPFSCSVCKKSFSTKHAMTTHMRTHTGEKPFACSACVKRFNSKNDMIRHMRTHTGEKPFICSVCKKRFSQKHVMTTHMRTHTGEKPFSCTVCDKTFRLKHHVSKHKCVTVMEAAGI